MRTRILLTRLIAAAALALASVGVAADPAGAESTLEVATVQGRDVELVLTLDASTPSSASSRVSGVLEIGGTVIPAESELVLAADDRPRTAILVLDASGSMAGARLGAARRAASGFLEAMPADVAVGLITFADRVSVPEAPTLDREAIRAAIDQVRASGDTSLHDAVLEALRQAPASSRIVVLSDGKDTVSRASLAEVTAAAAAGDAPVDAVAVNPSEEQLASLRSIVEASGGSLRTARTVADLVSAFAAASNPFGNRVLLRAAVPADVEASGQRITATVGIDDAVVEASTTLPATSSLQPVVQPPTAPAPADREVPVPNGILPLSLAVLIALSIATIGIVAVRARQHRRTVQRVEQVLRYRTGASRTSRAIARELAERPVQPTAIDQLVARLPGARRTREALAAAEFPLTPTAWLFVRIGAAAGLSVLLALLLGRVLLGTLLGVGVVWLAAWLVLRSRANSRQQAFGEALPDFLMILASGLRSGLSFTNALQSAADEDTGEVGRQIRRALREVQVGATLDDALMSCADRMDNDDLRWTVTALAIQREVGGNLSSILDTAAATIKGRDELRREVRTLSAEGRLSAYILVALPLGVFAFLLVFRRAYVSLLWTDPLGLVMLAGLVALMVVGWVWMRSIVRIRV